MSTIKNVALSLELGQLWEWHQAVYAGTQQFARRCQSWRCVIDEYPQREFQLRPHARRYDGVIARATSSLARAARRHQIPLVNVWMHSPERRVPSVISDHKESGRLAARHLVDRGLRNFGFIGREDTRNRSDILPGFLDHLKAAELEPPSVIRFLTADDDFTSSSWKTMQNEIRKCLRELTPPIGLLVERVYHARQVVHVCRDWGLHVPHDVAIICLENELTICENPPPTLTAIDLNWRKVGYEAARLLDQLMQGGNEPDGPILIPPKEIVPRASTDFHFVEDEQVAAALRYISENLRRSLTIENVARAVLTSPRTLQRKFKEHVNRSVAAEIRRLRIELAQRLLCDPDRQLTQVARTCGFGSARRMREVLQRELGVSPRDYRAKVISEG